MGDGRGEGGMYFLYSLYKDGRRGIFGAHRIQGRLTKESPAFNFGCLLQLNNLKSSVKVYMLNPVCTVLYGGKCRKVAWPQ